MSVFLRFFNDVDHITEVDDIRLSTFAVRSVYRILAKALNPARLESAQIIAAPTAIVEYGAILVD
jgi:hypothetical protein